MALIQAFTYLHTSHCQRPSKTYILVCEWENQLFWQQEIYKVSARRARCRRVPAFIGRVRCLAPSPPQACPRSPAAPSTVFTCRPGKHNFGAIALRNINNRTLAAKQWRHIIEKEKKTQQEGSEKERNNNEVKKIEEEDMKKHNRKNKVGKKERKKRRKTCQKTYRKDTIS